MNDWSTKEFEWDDSTVYDKGKVLSKEDLDGIENLEDILMGWRWNTL